MNFVWFFRNSNIFSVKIGRKSWFYFNFLPHRKSKSPTKDIEHSTSHSFPMLRYSLSVFIVYSHLFPFLFFIAVVAMWALKSKSCGEYTIFFLCKCICIVSIWICVNLNAKNGKCAKRASERTKEKESKKKFAMSCRIVVNHNRWMHTHTQTDQCRYITILHVVSFFFIHSFYSSSINRLLPLTRLMFMPPINKTRNSLFSIELHFRGCISI